MHTIFPLRNKINSYLQVVKFFTHSISVGPLRADLGERSAHKKMYTYALVVRFTTSPHSKQFSLPVKQWISKNKNEIRVQQSHPQKDSTNCTHEPFIPREIIWDAGLRIFKVIKLQKYIQQPQHAPARPLKPPLPPPHDNHLTNMTKS